MFAGPISDNEGNVVIAEGETIPFDERIDCCQWLVEGVVGADPRLTVDGPRAGDAPYSVSLEVRGLTKSFYGVAGDRRRRLRRRQRRGPRAAR